MTTPAFIGGGDPGAKDGAELRLASFKGALRFWWRATMAGEVGNNVDELHRREAELFGASAGGPGGGGQSAVRMFLEVSDKPKPVEVGDVLKDGRTTVGSGARYLGYGVMTAFGKDSGKLTRACLPAPFEFTVQMRLKPTIRSRRAELERAIKVMGLFGGLGSKSRKGYGSLTLMSLKRKGDGEVWTAPTTTDEFLEAITTLKLSPLRGAQPEWTAFSDQARVMLVPARKGDSAMALLNRLGEDLVMYRSWGNEGRVLEKEKAERNFREDHDLIYEVKGVAIKHPKRVAFGLPHNYFIKDRKKPGRRKTVFVGALKYERRASPLFFHIHEVENQTPIGVVLLMPARFLPERELIVIGKGRDAKSAPLSANVLEPVDAFLTRLKEGPKPKQGRPYREPYAGVKEVRFV
ncbi:type III-B CRISPR module RAMP protein Cmr1 [Lujinxingia vulgaris]|uniref:type III-B CRISPR module RAMP protein Cmr1 n=1 Tax=Lujinxingia vulgaris TaxID=2600176 RepID=UPI001E48FCCD|nr:type III-B CRISPR module RAMP protein Cmr1 [Lujinxingia vulgaris]